LKRVFADIAPNGAHYALLKHHGKQKRQSLETTSKALAKRKLADLKNGLSSPASPCADVSGLWLQTCESRPQRNHTTH